ncbi:uncharacterized protein BDV17DRAFT_35009 [Aspergillus undulatus]|uniref:uncharacterized protein n=1 Tax=Aspergillus undulatus TaxID=1810928 RepID=UPI003CCD7C2B
MRRTTVLLFLPCGFDVGSRNRDCRPDNWPLLIRIYALCERIVWQRTSRNAIDLPKRGIEAVPGAGNKPWVPSLGKVRTPNRPGFGLRLRLTESGDTGARRWQVN